MMRHIPKIRGHMAAIKVIRRRTAHQNGKRFAVFRDVRMEIYIAGLFYHHEYYRRMCEK